MSDYKDCMIVHMHDTNHRVVFRRDDSRKVHLHCFKCEKDFYDGKIGFKHSISNKVVQVNVYKKNVTFRNLDFLGRYKSYSSGRMK